MEFSRRGKIRRNFAAFVAAPFADYFAADLRCNLSPGNFAANFAEEFRQCDLLGGLKGLSYQV